MLMFQRSGKIASGHSSPLSLHLWLFSVAFLCRTWGNPSHSTTSRLKRCWSASSLREPTIKANYFGLYMTRRTSAPEIAGTDWWPSWYKGDEVIMTMRWYKKKLIAVAKKMRPRHIRFWDEFVKDASSSQLMNYHYYLKCKGMLSVNGWNLGMVACNLVTWSRADRKLRLRKSVLNDCTQWRGRRQPIWCALNVGSIW